MSEAVESKVVLVTGASRGIGAAIADRLGEAGYIVLGTATTEAGAQKISGRFQSKSITGQGYVLDVCDDASQKDLLAAAQEKWGPILILVNNAGITRDNLLLRMKEDEWDAVHNTNLKSVFSLTKKLVRPMMKARFGRIVSITSVVAACGNPGQANYCAAKAGVIGLTKSVALELASRGITANCIAPGFIQSDMTDALSDEQKEGLKQQIPLRKIGMPSDIAESVLFLVGNGAGYITGQTLHVNGGMYLP